MNVVATRRLASFSEKGIKQQEPDLMEVVLEFVPANGHLKL